MNRAHLYPSRSETALLCRVLFLMICCVLLSGRWQWARSDASLVITTSGVRWEILVTYDWGVLELEIQGWIWRVAYKTAMPPPYDGGSKHLWNVGQFLPRLHGAASQKTVIFSHATFVCLTCRMYSARLLRGWSRHDPDDQTRSVACLLSHWTFGIHEPCKRTKVCGMLTRIRIEQNSCSWCDVVRDHLPSYAWINSKMDNPVLIKFSIGEFYKKLKNILVFI
jgi:hypothetical protein